MSSNRRITLFLALALPIFAWAPLTYPGYFEFHTGLRPLFNLSDLARHLPALGWAPMIGQPLDLLRGEGDFAYWLALIPRALGASALTAVKWIFGASLVAGALGMYSWARRTLGDWPALLAAFVYVFWPIGLATIYVRGALAEAVLLAGMPWLLWAAEASLVGQRRGWVILAVGLATAFWTQAGLAMWLAVLLLGYLLNFSGDRSLWPVSDRATPVARSETGHSRPRLLRRYLLGYVALVPHMSNSPRISARHQKTAAPTLLGWLGGVLLGAAGLLPVIFQHGFGGQTYVAFADHFVYPHQLLQAGWGTGSSIAGPYDTLTFQLGLMACGLAVLGVLLGNKPTPHDSSGLGVRFTTRFGLTLTLLIVLLATILTAPLWQLLPFLARTLTYPWQLLLLGGPWLAWLAGRGGRALLDLLPAEQRAAGATPIFAALLALTLFSGYTYLTPTPISGPLPDTPLAIFGDNEIALLAAETTGLPAPSMPITISVRWQALRSLERDYTVFFHAISPEGQIQGQQDTMPQDNKLPTSQWRPGQVVDDRYRAILKADAPARGDYAYHLGLYLWQTGQRLRTAMDNKAVLK